MGMAVCHVKHCSKCKQNPPVLGQRYCAPCKKLYMRTWRAEQTAKLRAYRKINQITNRIAHRAAP